MDAAIKFDYDTNMWNVYSTICGVVIEKFNTEKEAYDFVRRSGYNLKLIKEMI